MPRTIRELSREELESIAAAAIELADELNNYDGVAQTAKNGLYTKDTVLGEMNRLLGNDDQIATEEEE